MTIFLGVNTLIAIAARDAVYQEIRGIEIIFQDASSIQNTAQLAVRAAFIRDLIIAAVCAVLFLLGFFILLAGAGRRRGEAGVHFRMIDKPYLDLSLALIIGWVLLTVLFALELLWQIDRFMDFSSSDAPPVAVHVILTAAALLTVIPILLWFLSFIKRIKAGGFWRHTLVYTILSRGGRFVWKSGKRLANSLWAGAPLMMKVGIIVVGAFFLLLFTGLLGLGMWHPGPMLLMTLASSIVVAFFLLRYALRIHRLEQGAKEAVKGARDGKIDVGGGELGQIAAAINSISDGISYAVEERMKSERFKAELITNVSHDIRTPLTSIITYTDLLKQEGLTCEKAPEYLDILVQKSQRLKTLTDELFEASKAASGNVEVNITALDFVALVRQVLGELDGTIKSSSLDLRVNLPERLVILADGKLMWRVLENLLSNVFKYALSGSRVYLDMREADGAACIDLKNISAVELNVDPSELTERFKRGDDSRTDGGTGLGLSIVQSFVMAQGGKFGIYIDGDLFKATVWMPLAEQ